MTRSEQKAHNQLVIERVAKLVRGYKYFHAPSYQFVIGILNAKGLLTSRGNHWTPKRLLRMLQRQGVRGLHGLFQQVALV
jgi:hypothetical protein